jgi:deazaflavin-dependent oxidoreductase (nitroreductase family)
MELQTVHSRDLRASRRDPLHAIVSARAPGLVRRLGAAHRFVYCRSGGRLVARWFGLQILVLETVGRRSGRHRRTPVCYLPEGDNFVVVPANGGARRVPAWWLNLRAAGEGIAVVGRLRRRVRPVLADGERRDLLRGRLLVAYPGLEAYLARARRNVPIVALEPV